MEQRLTQLLHICSRVITIESLNVDAELQQLAPISSLKVSSETLDLLSEYASLRVEQEKAVFQSVYDFYLAYKENLPKSKFGQLVLSVRSQELQVNVSKRKLERTEESTIPQKKYRPEISTILQEWLFKHLVTMHYSHLRIREILTPISKKRLFSESKLDFLLDNYHNGLETLEEEWVQCYHDMWHITRKNLKT